MEDKSIIKPFLEGLEYFNNSAEEITYFYKIIDKFCANWFGKNIAVKDFTAIEYFLIHELLGEFIRFEENNKRIALWLLSINRAANNYNTDLSKVKTSLNQIQENEDHDIDASLIEPILNELKLLEGLHDEAGKNNTGGFDIISNYLQWVMVYVSVVYPSLGEKINYYDKVIVTSMNFILREFIKQRSNSRRIAYLIMGIKEACKIFSIHNPEISKDFLESYKESGNVLPGKEEEITKEILSKLQEGNLKQNENELFFGKITPVKYVMNTYEKFIVDLNFYFDKPIQIFNKYVFDFTNKFLTMKTPEEKSSFIGTLLEYQLTNIKINKQGIIDSLKNSVNLFPENTKNWLKTESNKFSGINKTYLNQIIKTIESKASEKKFRTSKLYFMLILLNKLKIF